MLRLPATASLASLLIALGVAPSNVPDEPRDLAGASGLALVRSAPKLDLRFTEVDGVPIDATACLRLKNGPVGSSFKFSHTLTLHNYGTRAADAASLITLPGWRDQEAMARAVTLEIATSPDGFASSSVLARGTIYELEHTPFVGLPLNTDIPPGGELEIRLSYSGDLSQASEGDAISPSFTFVFGA